MFYNFSLIFIITLRKKPIKISVNFLLFRNEDPFKYEKLEERIRGDGTPGETAVGFKTAVTIIENPSQSQENNTYLPRSPEYSVSQGFTPAGTTTNYPPPQSQENNTFQEFTTTATIPTYTPQSP